MCNTLKESSTHVDVEFNYDKVDIDDNDNYDNNVKEESDNDIEDKKTNLQCREAYLVMSSGFEIPHIWVHSTELPPFMKLLYISTHSILPMGTQARR